MPQLQAAYFANTMYYFASKGKGYFQLLNRGLLIPYFECIFESE